MKIFFSILINAWILAIVAYFLSENPDMWIANGVQLACDTCSIFSIEAAKTYILWGIILGIINVTIRPILKILSLPFFFLFFGLASFIINGIILFLFTYIINSVLQINGVWYEIIGNVNFIIAVAIFTILNTLYSLLFFK